MRWIAVAIALLLSPLFVLPAAAIDTTSGSYVDLAPVLNPLIQTVGAILAAAALPLALFIVNWMRKKANLAAIEVDAGLQAKIDAVAQKVIGGAIARAQIVPGQIGVDVHNVIISDAANKLAAELGDTLTQAGSKDNVAKAREIIQNRLGMMTATAQGTPIPNPSADAAAAPAAPVAVVAPVALPAVPTPDARPTP